MLENLITFRFKYLTGDEAIDFHTLATKSDISEID